MYLLTRSFDSTTGSFLLLKCMGVIECAYFRHRSLFLQNYLMFRVTHYVIHASLPTTLNLYLNY